MRIILRMLALVVIGSMSALAFGMAPPMIDGQFEYELIQTSLRSASSDEAIAKVDAMADLLKAGVQVDDMGNVSDAGFKFVEPPRYIPTHIIEDCLATIVPLDEQVPAQARIRAVERCLSLCQHGTVRSDQIDKKVGVAMARLSLSQALPDGTKAKADAALRKLIALDKEMEIVVWPFREDLVPGGVSAADACVHCLQDPSRNIRIAAIESLAIAGGSKHVPFLRPLLSDPNLYVRLRAAVAVWKLDQDPLACDALRKELRSTDPHNQLLAIRTVYEFGPGASPARDDVMKFLRSSTPQDPSFWAALHALASLGDLDTATAEAQELLNSNDSWLIARAADWLRSHEVKSQSVLDYLTSTLSSGRANGDASRAIEEALEVIAARRLEGAESKKRP